MNYLYVGKEKELKYKSGLIPFVETGHLFYEELPKRPALLAATKECPFWGLIEPFFKEQPIQWTNKEYAIETEVFTKLPEAIEMILGCYKRNTLKEKQSGAFHFGGNEHVPTAEDFAVIFKMQRIKEDPDMTRKLAKPRETHLIFLNKEFPREPNKKDYKITRQKIESRMIDAIVKNEPPEYFLIFLGMWICTIFFFTDSSGNFFSQKWIPHIFLMYRVSWPDLVVNYLMENINTPKGKKGLKSVAGCTPFLLVLKK